MSRMTLLVLLAAFSAGCAARPAAKPVKVEQAELGRQFLLAEEPAGAVGILDFRESLAPDAELPAEEISLLARIGGGQPTWSSQSASFLVCDPAHTINADHVCDNDNCPFCKAKQGEDKSHAIVMLTGSDDRVPALDVRKLLPLEEGQLVVVRGRAQLNSLGQLVVHARGLYVRR